MKYYMQTGITKQEDIHAVSSVILKFNFICNLTWAPTADPYIKAIKSPLQSFL